MSGPDDGAILVVDAGTSVSSAALVADGEITLIKEPSSLTWFWPSSVYLDENVMLVGTQAEHRKIVSPACFRTEFKRDLGQDIPVYLGERSCQPRELVTAIIAALRAEAERVHGGQVSRAVLTIPAAYSPADSRRDLMIRAAEDAGLPIVELIPEPVAAAFAPPAGAPFSPADTVLVYDFGGGTFDAALVKIGDYQYEPEVLRHRSLDDCGGRDIDAAMMDWFRDHGPEALASLLTPGTGRTEPAGALAALRSRLELAELVRHLKHQLSEAPNAIGFLSSLGIELGMTQDEFHKLADPLIDRTIKCCQDLLASAQVQASQVAAVLLVGGSSRMPAVAAAVAAGLKIPVRPARDPELAVLQGAINFAGKAAGRFALPASNETDARPLRWTIPGGTATLLRWRVGDGEPYRPSQAIAEVRLQSGAILRLCDSGYGLLRQRHAKQGATVASGDWLVTTEPMRLWGKSFGSRAVRVIASSGSRIVAATDAGTGMGLAAESGNQAWCPQWPSGPNTNAVIRDGTLYLCTGGGAVRAIDCASGKVRWQTRLSGNKFSIAPVASGDVLCVQADSGDLYALNTANGSTFWRQRIGLPGTGYLALNASTVYVSPGPRGARAFDVADGAVRWEAKRTDKSASSGGPLLVADGTLYEAASTALVAYDSVTGKVRWTNGTQGINRLATSGDLLFASYGTGGVNGHQAGTGNVHWSRKVAQNVISLLTAAEDTLFVGSTDSRLYALRAEDGKELWKSAVISTPTCAVVAGQVIYVGYSNGSILAFDSLTGKTS